jgi:catalase
MHGFGSHTYSLINSENKRFWVKFTFKTQQGIQNLTDAEAVEVIGRDRESHQRDFFESIERGEFPRWKLFVQIMNEEDANTYHIHPFDLTKVWPHSDYPLIEVGEIELNRYPRLETNIAPAIVAHAATNTTNVVRGMRNSLNRWGSGRHMVRPDETGAYEIVSVLARTGSGTALPFLKCTGSGRSTQESITERAPMG